MRRALVTVLVVIVAGCVPRASFQADPTPFVTSPVDGVIISIQSEGLGQVRSFSLQPASSPFAFRFTLGTLENPTEFPPSHLAEHQATSAPVRVYFVTENGEHIVYRLEDAPEPSAT